MTPPSPHPPVEHLVREFRVHERRRGVGDWTIAQRVTRVRGLARDVAPRHPLDLTTVDLEEWMDEREGRVGRLKRGSRRTYRGHLRSFYRWARDAGHIDVDPSAELVKVQVGRALPRPAADDVVADAMDRADVRMLAWLALGAYEGLRCVEMSRLCREDISIPGMAIRVEGKGDKVRYVPLHPETLAALRHHGLPHSGYVFTRQWRQKGAGTAPLHPQTISRLISRHLPRGTTAHQLRHWFGTEFYRAERDLLLTAQVMGHSSTRTTEGYAAADTSRAAGIVEGLSVRRRVEPSPPTATDWSLPGEDDQDVAY